MDLGAYIRDVPDFPQPGIIFKDITPLLISPEGFKVAVDRLADRYRDVEFDKIIAVESRGFIFAGALGYILGKGVVLARKPGKLPAESISESYTLEYGTNTLEVHQDAIGPGEKILVLDDLLATGGTLAATCRLVERLGGQVVEVVTLIELAFLNGREKISGYPYFTFLKY